MGKMNITKREQTFWKAV